MKMQFCFLLRLFVTPPSDFTLLSVHGAKKEIKNRVCVVFSCTLELADISLTPKFPSSFPQSAPVGGQHIKLT